jgi:rhamnose utilization protein RhaD (predicted bifunctional aldolase and dehydrogenase)/NAD(P)-dependent dehydrogenase (short-subunit alcohol dehydrogenase family)
MVDISYFLNRNYSAAPLKPFPRILMKNRYDEKEAQAYIEKYKDHPEELALRVYTSRLIGQEEDLVLHGGGNTSAKSRITNILGENMDVIFVKGSGWDLGAIEPQGLPGLDLEYLKKLRPLENLSDEEMVNQFRTHLLNASSPNPSIETLVHSFLPPAYIDHTHADAIVTLTNLNDCETILRDALGDNIGILPFIMPGFPLAKAVADLYESNPGIECLILRNHGIFTFGDDARTAYDRMIHFVTLAEKYIARQPAAQEYTSPPETTPDESVLFPLLRGALAHTDPQGNNRIFHLHLRKNARILAALSRPDARDLLVTGVLTPDHVIRTKNYPLFLDFTELNKEEEIADLIKSEIASYQEKYNRYFAEQVRTKKIERTRLDSMPRVMLIKDIGIVTAGKTPKDAIISADIATHTLEAKLQGSRIAPYKELEPSFIFDMEYWSLEQAKLGKGSPQPLEGKIALVTGGGGAIACGIGRQLLASGARVFLTDIDADRLHKVEEILASQFDNRMISSLVMDVTDEESVQEGMNTLVQQAGGLDILVPNAGIAHVARLEELEDSTLKKVIDVNLIGVFQVIKAAIPLFKRQNFGGHIIINSSKNVFAPGAAFGAYSASKAGAHQLGKIAALELAEIGVRVNMINADAIFNDQDVSSGLWDVVGPDRMKSRNLDPEGLKEYYRQRNLLKTEVVADHVGNGVVFFASGLTPTTGATLPVDGGVEGAFPR